MSLEKPNGLPPCLWGAAIFVKDIVEPRPLSFKGEEE